MDAVATSIHTIYIHTCTLYAGSSLIHILEHEFQVRAWNLSASETRCRGVVSSLRRCNALAMAMEVAPEKQLEADSNPGRSLSVGSLFGLHGGE